ncbi:MAG: ABC transporter substrate-binding protein [Candidatus Omnitrophica bacterium]|nr:ABC transporter substrate-binding protein [Candidatus Omnitrophota bacterium]
MKHLKLFLLMGLLFFLVGVPTLQASEVSRLTIALDDWVGYGLFYLAKEKGFMRDEGVDLVFVDEPLDSARRDAFQQGILDCEGGTLDLLASKIAQNSPIVSVMETDQSFGSDGIVANENIKTLEDLKGKTVALARDDAGETFISVVFHKKDLSFNDLVIVSTAPENVAETFVKNEAEACVTWEPQISQALQKPGAHILTSSREYPGIIIDTLNVRKDLVEKDPLLVKKLMRGWFTAVKYYQEHPVEASGIVAKYYKMSSEEYRKQVAGLKWISYEEQKSILEYKKLIDTFKVITDIKFENGRISQKFDGTKFINHTLLEKLYENRR